MYSGISVLKKEDYFNIMLDYYAYKFPSGLSLSLKVSGVKFTHLTFHDWITLIKPLWFAVMRLVHLSLHFQRSLFLVSQLHADVAQRAELPEMAGIQQRLLRLVFGRCSVRILAGTPTILRFFVVLPRSRQMQRQCLHYSTTVSFQILSKTRYADLS